VINFPSSNGMALNQEARLLGRLWESVFRAYVRLRMVVSFPCPLGTDRLRNGFDHPRNQRALSCQPRLSSSSTGSSLPQPPAKRNNKRNKASHDNMPLAFLIHLRCGYVAVQTQPGKDKQDTPSLLTPVNYLPSRRASLRSQQTKQQSPHRHRQSRSPVIQAFWTYPNLSYQTGAPTLPVTWSVR